MAETILIIDDDPGISILLKTMVQREGYHTLVANSAAEGLTMYQETRPDLILLDIAMPGTDGIQLAHQIREKEQESVHTPLVFLTAHGQDTFRGRIGALDIAGYLTKPITTERLRTALKQHLT